MLQTERTESKPFRLARGLVLILAVMLGLFFLIRGALTLMEPSRAYRLAEATPARVSAAGPARANAVKIDSSFDAFHRAANALPDIKTVVIGEDAPETDLNLTLTGRRASTDGAGSATLLLPDGAQDTFLRGETILRNVTLEAVYPTHIIISRNGTHERVTFERTSGALFQTSPDSDTPRAAQADIERLSQQLGAGAQQALEGFTPESFLKSVRPSPVRQKGRVVGYRLQSLNPSLDLGALGLESGDIITHIGGNDLRQGSPDFSNLFKQFERNPSSFNLTLTRDGQPVTVTPELN